MTATLQYGTIYISPDEIQKNADDTASSRMPLEICVNSVFNQLVKQAAVSLRQLLHVEWVCSMREALKLQHTRIPWCPKHQPLIEATPCIMMINLPFLFGGSMCELYITDDFAIRLDRQLWVETSFEHPRLALLTDTLRHDSMAMLKLFHLPQLRTS